LNERYDKLAREQRENILNACIEEFAAHGYAQASTNAIVKRANIPKGTLFYFFGSKKDLFLYILDYAVASYAEQFKSLAGELPTDLFERLKFIHKERMQFVLSQPLLFQLFYNAFVHTDDEIRADLQDRYKGYATGSQEMLSRDIDRSKFRDDVDVEKAVKMINLMLEGLLSSHMAELKNSSPETSLEVVEKISQECEDYFEMIRKGIYRQ
jgi:TetR/AcrR family transcriptional regulator